MKARTYYHRTKRTVIHHDEYVAVRYGRPSTVALPFHHLQVQALHERGWPIVPRSEAQEFCSNAIAEVYERSGRLCISTGNVTVKFAPMLTEASRNELVDSYDARIVEQLAFDPSLYVVRSNNTQQCDAIDLANALAEHVEVEFAEPVFIDPLGGRS